MALNANLTKTQIWVGVIVAFLMFAYLTHNSSSSAVTTTAPRTVTSKPPVSEPPLMLMSYTWHIESGYAILEGQVKNVSDQSLKNVEAIGTFYDAKDGFITTAEALISYNPVLAGQTSPFKLYATENPAMKKASVEFKNLLGGTIAHRKAEKKK